MPTRNPFEPPQSPVDALGSSGDIDAAPMQRPSTIDRAFWLIVASAGLGLVSYVARGMHESAGMMLFVMAYLLGFAFLIRAGQNWARIVYLIFFALGALAMLYVKEMLARVGAVYIGIMFAQTAFQGYAAWLAFTQPGSAWFRRFPKTRS